MFRVITTCYNAAEYIQRCLESLQGQNREDWICYVLDDISTDESRGIVSKMAWKDPRIILISNKSKTYQVGNYQKIMSREEIDDDDICLTLDGDDWLPDDKVLDRLAEAYDNGAWITYGQFLEWDGQNLKPGFAQNPPIWNELRKLRYTTTHLRTWKAFLWRNIKSSDLRKSDGGVIKAGGDTAFMYPMLEMAGPYRSVYIPHFMYVYNVQTPDNVHKHSMKDQHDTANEIRQRPPYEQLPYKQYKRH